MKLPALLRALRPQQWVKNVFVLAAVVFARADLEATHAPGDWSDVWNTLYAFAAFCLGASAIYLVNDVLDVESDRAHPTKRNRPIASGELSVATAIAVAVVCAAAAVFLAREADRDLRVLVAVGVYVALNFAYSVWLKHVVIVDAFCIAGGFFLRVKAGALAAHTYMSHWLLLCTLFLSLFLALCKRRAEFDLLGEERGAHRANLRHYTPAFLDQMVTALAACTVVCYTMWSVDSDTEAKFGEGNRLIYTVPFVVFGLARYLLLVSQQKAGGNPTRMLLGGDLVFVLNGLAWAAVTALAVFSERL
jgi:4-hydroxybenzoate polyprenyltransferase